MIIAKHERVRDESSYPHAQISFYGFLKPPQITNNNVPHPTYPVGKLRFPLVSSVPNPSPQPPVAPPARNENDRLESARIRC